MVVVLDCHNVSSMRWRLGYRQSDQNLSGGSSTPLVFGKPYWMVDVQYSGLDHDRYSEVESDFMKMNGAVEEVQIWRMNKRRPRQIQNADENSVSSIIVVAAEAAVDTTGGLLVVGDMISYDAEDGGRYVGAIDEIVSASGVQTVFQATPPLVNLAAPANALIFEAYGLFRMDPTTFATTEPMGSGFGSISATFRQVEPG